MNLGRSGKVALILGGSRGLGGGVAREFGDEGCKDAIAARSRSGIDKTVAEITAALPRPRFDKATDQAYLTAHQISVMAFAWCVQEAEASPVRDAHSGTATRQVPQRPPG